MIDRDNSLVVDADSLMTSSHWNEDGFLTFLSTCESFYPFSLAKLSPSVVAQEIYDDILILIFTSLSTSVLLNVHLRSKHTRYLLSKIIQTDIVLSSIGQLQDFVSNANKFYVMFKSKYPIHIEYAYCNSLQITLPSMGEPVISGLKRLLKSSMHIKELALVCYEADFPIFIANVRLSHLQKLLVHYPVVSTQLQQSPSISDTQ